MREGIVRAEEGEGVMFTLAAIGFGLLAIIVTAFAISDLRRISRR